MKNVTPCSFKMGDGGLGPSLCSLSSASESELEIFRSSSASYELELLSYQLTDLRDPADDVDVSVEFPDCFEALHSVPEFSVFILGLLLEILGNICSISICSIVICSIVNQKREGLALSIYDVKALAKTVETNCKVCGRAESDIGMVISRSANREDEGAKARTFCGGL